MREVQGSTYSLQSTTLLDTMSQGLEYATQACLANNNSVKSFRSVGEKLIPQFPINERGVLSIASNSDSLSC